VTVQTWNVAVPPQNDTLVYEHRHNGVAGRPRVEVDGNERLHGELIDHVAAEIAGGREAVGDQRDRRNLDVAVNDRELHDRHRAAGG